MNNTKAEVLFDQYVRMAKHIARQTARTMKTDPVSTEDEAVSLLGILISHWDDPNSRMGFNPERSSDSSWVYRNLKFGLIDWCRKQIAKRKRTTPISESIKAPEGSWLPKHLAMISDDARTVISTILAAPSEFTSRAYAKIARFAKKKLLSIGWTSDRLDRAWSEAADCW